MLSFICFLLSCYYWYRIIHNLIEYQDETLTVPISLFLLLFPVLKETEPPKYYCDLCQRLYSMFSSGSFMISGLPGRSLIHFEFIFCIQCQEVFQFHSFIIHIVVQFSHHYLLKTIFSPLYVLASFVTDLLANMCEFNSVPLICVYFCVSTILFYLLYLCYIL